MPAVDRRLAHDHQRARLAPARIAVVWGTALAIALTFLLIQAADRQAREESATASATALADSTASLVADEVRNSLNRLESTATALLAGEVDRATMDAAMPVTGLPLLAVLDSSTMEVLAINLDFVVDGAQIVAAMPSVAEAFEGRRSVGQLAGVTGAPIVAFAVPYEAQDGSDRVLAVGVPLDQSRFPGLLEGAPDRVHVGIHAADGTELLDNGAPESADMTVTSALIDPTNWHVEVSGRLDAFDPDLASPWQDLRWLTLVTLLIAGSLAFWFTRALRDAATIEAAYGRLAWGARQQREMTALISHELRTPATSAAGLATILAQKWDSLGPERRRELAERVARSTTTLSDLVQDLDLSSLLTDGIVPLELTDQRIGEILDGAVAQAELKRYDLTIRGDVDTVVSVDLSYAVRALAGVLRNASVHGGAPIEISVATEGPEVVILVRDHGPGVPDDFRDLLFEPFTQAQSHLRRTHGGTGLGLHLVSSIIEQLGGRITHHDATPGAAFAIHLRRLDQRRSTNTESASAIRAST